MKSLATVIGAAALLALVPAARATPIMYTFDATGNGDTLTGTFTFDSSVPSLLSVDITVTGSVLPAVFTVPSGAGGPTCSATIGSDAFSFGFPGSCFTAMDSGDTEALILTFPDLLSTTTDRVDAVSFVTATAVDIFGLNGTADPVPEPGTLALFASALLGLGFLARRKRRAS